MTGNLFGGAGTVGLIVTTAYLLYVGGATLIYVAGGLIAKAKGISKRRSVISDAIIGVGVLLAMPAALVAALSVPLTAALLAIPVSTAGWVLILAFCGFLLWRTTKKSSHGAEGCTKLIGIAMLGYAVVWAATALALGPESRALVDLASVATDAAAPSVEQAGSELLRALLVALPFWLMLMILSEAESPVFAFGFALFIAVVASVTLGPVERGFAASILPESDWLRFPITGLATGFMMSWPSLFFTVINKKPRRDWTKYRRSATVTLILGLLLGLLWAVTRLLF